MKNNLNYLTMYLMMGLLCFASCSDNDSPNDPEEEMEETQDMGKLSINITDAPIDDANIDAVFVTVAAVEVDGQRVDLEQKKTINVHALP